MTAVAFDTLKVSRAFREKAKLSPEQADGFAEAIAEAVQGDLATKADMDLVRADLREAELRLQAQIEASKAELMKWALGAFGLQTIVIIGSVVALVRPLIR